VEDILRRGCLLRRISLSKRALRDHVPVPLSVTICGVFAALSFMVKVPAMVPFASGLNLTLILQLAPGCSVEHVVALVKPAVIWILDTTSGALPVFDSVTALAALVVPTLWFPKLRLLGLAEPIATGVAVAVGVEVAVDVAV
jgi:hypothetical protein